MKKVLHSFLYTMVSFSCFVCLSNEKNPETPMSFASKSLVASSFTTSPAAVGGTITICNGQSITYTNTSTGVSASSTYTWSFVGGNSTSANTVGPHTIIYPTAGNYTTTLTVDGIDSSVNVVVTNAIVPTLNITNTGSGYSTSIQNGVKVFTRCSNLAFGNFQFVDPNTANYPTGTTFNVVWGDGTPNATIIGTHNYTSAGVFQMTYTANYPGGCSLATNFTVFIGNAPPTVTITGSGGSACNPNSYQFTILSSNNTIPGTTYTITINDGSAPIVFPNGLPSNPYVFNYLFPDTSCGNNSTINNSVYADSYSIQVVASNPCSPQGTFTSIGPIRVSLETKPAFSQSSDVACIESMVTFIDATDAGENVGSFGCNPDYGMYWEITPNTGFTVAAGSSLGSSNGFTEVNGIYDWNEWTNGSTPLDILFHQPGTYTIKLITGNDCGMQETQNTICITPAVVADFNLSPANVCSPGILNITNTSSVPICSNSNNYNWVITQANPSNCPGVVSPGWAFSSGNASSFEPKILFTSPGEYTIQLTTSLQNVVPGILCVDDVTIKTITVKDAPTTVLTTETICQGDSITLSPVVNNCYSTQAVTYNWNFGGSPPTTISSTSSPNPTMIFANAGTYFYTLTLTNDCGSRSFTSSIIVNPKVLITASGPTATCLNSNIQLFGTISGGINTGTWTSSIPNGTFFPNATTLSPTYTPPQDFTGTIVFTLTSDDPNGPCPAVIKTVTVEFNEQAIADAGNYTPLCVNSIVTLNGTIGGAASSASWTSSNGGVFSNPNSLSSTYTPPANFSGTITLTLTTNDPSGPCLPAVDTVIITVLPTPTINPISNSTFCNGANVGPITFNGVNATAFIWNNSNPLIGLNASGTGDISFTAINNGTNPITATITVTPINTSSGINCFGIPTSFTITVNANGQINSILDIVVCNGNMIPSQVFSTTQTGGTTDYSWTNSNNTIGLVDNGTGNLPQFLATNTTSTPVSATITVTPSFTNNGTTCSGTPITFTIIVNPTGQIQPVNNTTVCNTQQVSIPFATLNSSGTTSYSWTNSNPSIGLAASGTGDLNFTASNISTTPISGIISVTPTYTNNGISCIGSVISFTITVNPSAQVNQPINLIYCTNDNIPSISLSTTNTIGTTTYSWNNDTPTIGLAASGNGNIPNFSAINTTTSPIIATLLVTPFYSDGSISCSGPTKSFTITINPSADVLQPTDLVFCNNVIVPTLNFSTANLNGTTTYNWTSNSTAIGISSSGIGFIPSFTTTNTTSQPITATITVTPSFSNGGVICSGIAKTFTITVNPTGELVQPTNVEYCNEATIPEIQFNSLNTIGTTTYAWTNSNGNIGLGSSGNGNIPSFVAQNNASSQISSTVTVTPTFTYNGESCIGTPKTFVISVNASPNGTLTGTSGLCVNGTQPLLTFTGTSGTAPFTFTYTLNNGAPQTITTLSGNSITLAAPTTTAGTFVYELVSVKDSNTVICTKTLSQTATITIYPLPTISTEPLATQSVCVGGTISALTVAYIGGTGTATYQWFSNTSASNSGGTIISSATLTSYTPPTFTTVGSYYFYCVVSLNGNGCNSTTSQVAEIIVVADPIVSNQPLANQSLCQGTTPTDLSVTATGGVGSYTYQWFSAASATGTGTAILNATNAIYTPNTTIVGTTYYYCEITQSGLGCSVTSAIAEVIIVPAPSIATQPIGSAVCIRGSTTTMSVSYINGTGIASYQWYSNTTNSTSGGTAVGTNSNTFTPSAAVLGTLYYYCVITFSSGGCTSVTSSTAEVIIYPLPTISTEPLATQSVCVGGTISALTVAYTGGTGTATYQWFSNTTASNTGGTIISGATLASFTPPTFSTVGSNYFYCVVSLNGNGCNSTTSQVSEIIVVADPIVSMQPLANQSLCQGTTPTDLSVTATGGVGSYAYQWFSSASATGTGTAILNATNAIYTPNTTIVGTTYYYCEITQSGLGCSVKSAISEIIIVPAPSIATQPIGSAVCIGGSTTTMSVSYINGTGIASYQWYSNTTNSTSGGTAVGTNSNTFTPSAATVGTLYYYCLITFSSGGCTSVTSSTAEVIIYPLPTISTEPLASQSVCVGGTISALTVAYTGGTGTATYQWYSNTSASNSGGTIIPSATLASFTPPTFTTVGSNYFYCIISLNGNGCNSTTSQVAEIIVVADPIVSIQPLANQSLCQGTTPTDLSVTASGGVGSYTYQWFSAASATGTGTAILNATNAIYTPNTTIVGTTYYYCEITQSGLGCSVTSAIAEVIIVPAPSIATQPIGSAVCIGGVTTTMSVSYINGTGIASYQWYSNTTNSTSGGTAVGANSSTFTPSAAVVGTLYYYCVITFSSGGCTSVTSNTAEVIIYPLPTISMEPLATQSVCVGGTISALTVAYTGGTGTATYQWYSNTSASNSGGTIISGATLTSYTPPTFTTVGSYYFYCVVSLNGNGCNSTTSQVAGIVVVADPIVSIQPLANQSLCQGTTPTDLSVTVTGGVGSFTYQWFSNTSATGTGTAILNATNAIYTPDTTIVGTTYYYCEITQSGLGCSVTSAIAEVIIVPAPSIATQPIGSAICIGGVTTTMSVSYINGTGIASYEWYSNTTNSTSGGTVVGTNTSTFTPSAATVGTLYYYCVVTFSSGGCTSVTSGTAEVIIYPIPSATNVNLISCSGETIIYIPQDGNGNTIPTTTQYSWGLPTINPIGAITGETAQITLVNEFNQILYNTTNQIATATYTLTPIAGICTGNTFTIEVIVYPKPIFDFSIPNQTICNETSSTEANLSSSNNGTITYEWTATIPAGITGAQNSGTNTIPAQLLTNTTNAPLTINYAAFATFNYNGNQCVGPVANYDITVNPSIQTSSNVSNYNGYGISFPGANNGFIDITISGGSGNYTYIWTDALGTPFSTNQDVSNLDVGFYRVSISDGLCNPIILDFLLTMPLDIIIGQDPTTQVYLDCFGDASGVLQFNLTQESVPPYTYQLFNSAGLLVASITNSTDLNPQFTGLISDTYSFTIIDANGGTKSITGLVVSQPNDIVITPTTTPITCYGANNASITLNVIGGTGPYSGAWNNLATGLSQTNLSAGNYTIMITDAKGCQKPITVPIPDAPVFMVNPIAKNITCHGANDGSIQMNLVGGVAPLAITWNDGSNAGLTRNNLGPGTYIATISDGTPCFISRTFTIIDPQVLVVGSSIVNATNCTNANSGTIDINVSGGVPPFNYVWSNGANTEDVTNIIAGNYSLVVTDANGCSKTGQFVVTRPSEIVLNVATQTDFNCQAKTAVQNFIAQSVGGVQPIQFAWSSGTVSGIRNQNMSTNLNGTIILTATDAIGCTKNYTFDVNLPNLGTVGFGFDSFAYQTYGAYSINDPIQFNSAITGDYLSIQWNFGDGQFSTELDPVHSYSVPGPYVVKLSVTYPFGCVYQKVISIIVTEGYKLIIPNAFTPNTDGLNESFLPKYIGLSELQLNIFDTWGELIYSEQGNQLTGWNGTINGIEAENGNYYYTLSGKTFYGEIITKNGPFVLIK